MQATTTAILAAGRNAAHCSAPPFIGESAPTF
jgi:hypothetical protein